MYELNMSPTLFFIALSVGRLFLAIEIILCGSVVLRMTSCRVRFKWFFTIYLWCNGSLVGEKREKQTNTFHTTHKMDDLKE